MTRMFKQLVESSRKKLSKAAPPASQPEKANPELLTQPRKKPDFEPLESRVLFSGIGNGFNKRSVRFIDAWGDAVLVKLVGGPGRFDITLDGGARNKADIQNITINGKANSSTVLDIYVKPKALTLSDSYTGGMKTYGDAVYHAIYAVTNANRTFTPGFVQIGSIYASTDLRGITMNGADFQDIDVTGNIGLGTKVVHGVTHDLNGGIAVDIGDSQFRDGLLYDPVQAIGFGNINVSGGVDALTLRGRTTTPATNNMVGTIDIGGAVTAIDARYSDVMAPINVASIGSALFNDILSNVTSTGAIGSLDADNLVASVTAGGTIGNLALNGSLLGTITAPAFTSVSVNGNFTGLLEATTAGIGSITINSGTAFTGTVEADAGNIGNIVLSQAATPFSGQVTAFDGNIGNITAGFFSDASVVASGSIGNITSNATSASITSGIVNSTFRSDSLGIGNIRSVASITDSQFEAVGGADWHRDGHPGRDVRRHPRWQHHHIATGDASLTTTIGDITVNLSIQGTTALASGAIGTITSIAGHIGGSATIRSLFAANNPQSNVFIGGSIGNIYALGDISGNVINATAGNVGNITSHQGRIAFDSVSATGNIGNIYANSQDASFAFDSAGNALGQPPHAYEYGLPSASAIDHSTFTAGGTIGTITARASAVGGYIATDDGSFYVANRGIDSSTFSAGAGIGNVYAFAAGSTYHAGEGIAGGINAAIFESNFISGGAGVGSVRGVATGGAGIYDSVIHAISGGVGAVTGMSISGTGIAGGAILADVGNVGVVTGISTGGNPGAAGINDLSITGGAGAAGTGKIAGIYGKSAHGTGISDVSATAGTGGITYVTGINTNRLVNATGQDGIYESSFTTTGPIGTVTGTAAGRTGIAFSHFTGSTIGATGGISGTTTGYGYGIEASSFLAASGIGAVTGAASTINGVGGITSSYFNASTGGASGAIASILGATAGDGSGINSSTFRAAAGIGPITGTATSVIGGSGISDSGFFADIGLTGAGAMGAVKGTTIGGGDGIVGSTFYSGAGITSIYGGAKGAYSGSGIAGSKFNADDAQLFTSTIGSIKGVSDAGSGTASGIVDSFFVAGASIGGITGATTAPGSHSYGIGDSAFFANAGPSTQNNGTGSIGSILGTSYAYGTFAFRNGVHAGIAGSIFVAGGGASATGSIGTIQGSAKVSGPAATTAYGIEHSTFVAGSGAGTITSVTGTAAAYGSSIEEFPVHAIGIHDGLIYAGTGAVSTGNSTIGLITGNATATAAFGRAYADGIDHSVVDVGGSDKGTISGITASGTATGHTKAVAYGIRHSHFQAATLSGGMGYINSVSGTAVATSQAYALAEGIAGSGFWAGYKYGKFGAVSGSGTATGETTVLAYGIDGVASKFKASYASSIPGGYTLKAGTSHSYGSGVTGAITGIAKATANTGEAKAAGIDDAEVIVGYSSGTINGTVTATAVAITSAGNATSAGIAGSHFNVALGYGGVGSIAGGITVTAASTTGSGSAYSYGIADSTFSAGLNHGIIGNVLVSAAATVTGSNVANTKATAIGIDKSDIYAGYSGIYGKIGTVTSTATATLHNSYQNPADTSVATATGISNSVVAAQANTLTFAADKGTGTIGAISGTGKAYSYGYQVKSVGTGIYESTFIASNGDQSTGTITSVYGHGIAKATGTDDNATALAYGIAGSPKADTYIEAGTGLNSTGHIGAAGSPAIYGKASATAVSPGNVTTFAEAAGISFTLAGAGTGAYNTTGYIGTVTGAGTAIATSAVAGAYAYGIGASVFASGRTLGVIGNVTGTATATATAYYGNATAKAHGIEDTTIIAGYGTNGNGAIGTVSGTGTATALAKGIFGTATALAYGIDPTYIGAGSVKYVYVPPCASSPNAPALYFAGKDAVAGTGTVAGISGIAIATAKDYAVNGTALAGAYGIGGLTVTLGTAYTNDGSAFGGTGTITNGITATATAYAKATNTGGLAVAHAAGIDDMTVEVGDAFGIAVAKGGTGTIGNINVTVSATAKGASLAYARLIGLEDVTLSAANAFAGSTPVDTAFGGTGVIGSLYQKQTAFASVTGPYGTAKAYATPALGLFLEAGNAYGGAAYGGSGKIAKGGSIKGVGSATATGYYTFATAGGLLTSLSTAGNAVGGYYATGGYGYIGQLIGTATATATSNKTSGSVSAKADAYGVLLAGIGAGNATVTSPIATARSYGGTGILGGFNGTATATAYAKSPYNGFSAAIASGILLVDAAAGNAYNFGTGPAKSVEGKIGVAGILKGTGTATSTAKGGAKAESYAFAGGVTGVELAAGNAVTHGGGKAIASKAYAYINTVGGYGTATAYAYGKQDPKATADAGGISGFLVYSGSAFADNTGAGGAYAAGSQGSATKSVVKGFKGVAGAYATAKGTAPTTSSSLAGGITYGRVESADAYSYGGGAYGGLGYLGQATNIYGKATAKSTADVSNLFIIGSATASGSAYGVSSDGFYAGNAISNDRRADAHGGSGKIGATTGEAYVTDSATGSPATVTGAASGIDTVTLSAGYAYGRNSYAGYGSIGAVMGKSTATSTETSITTPNTTNSTMFGYGIRDFHENAGVAYAIYTADGGTAKISTITGASSIISTSNTTAGTLTITDAGIKDAYVYAGDAVASSISKGIANSGPGAIGAISGTGYGKASGALVDDVTVWGIDPSVFDAGLTHASYVATSASGNSIGAITGSATAKAYGAPVTAGGSANTYAGAVASVRATAGYASGFYDAGTKTTYTDKVYGGSGSIGNISGIAYAKSSAYSANSNVDGISESYFSAGSAIGSFNTGTVTKSAKGNIGSLYGKAYQVVLGNTGDGGARATGVTAVGLVGTTVRSGFATGYNANASGANGSSIGIVTGKGSSKVTGYTVFVGDDANGISDLTLEAGYAYGIGTVTAGTGYIAKGGAIYGKGVSNGYSTSGGKLSKVTNFAGVGINSITIRAGVATSGSYFRKPAAGDKAYGAYGNIGNVTGKGYTLSDGAAGTYVHSYYTNGISFFSSIEAGTAYGYSLAKAGKGVIGNIFGIAKSTAEGLPVLSFSGPNRAHEAVGLRYVSVQAGNATAVGTTAGYSANGGNSSSVGSITGRAYSYATANGTTGTADAYAYGIFDSNAVAGNAKAPKAYAGSGTIGAVSANAIATATGYTAKAYAHGISYVLETPPPGFNIKTFFGAGDAFGSGASKQAAVAALGTVTSVSGKATADATAAVAGVNAKAYAIAYGVSNVKVTAGNAYGYKANAKHGAAGTDTIGTVYGYGSATSSGYQAKSFARGLNSVTLHAGYAGGANGTLKIYAGAAQVGNAGAGVPGIYGKAVGSATSPSTAAAKVTSQEAETKVYGIDTVTIFAGNANGGLTLGDVAYGAVGTVGNIKGLATSTATVDKGIEQIAYATGITVLKGYVGGAFAYASKAGGPDNIGYVSGKATAKANLSTNAPVVLAKADAYGVTNSVVAAGAAYAPDTTLANTAVANAGTIGALTGKAYAYSIVAAISGAATSTADGLSSFTARAGFAQGFVPTGAAGAIGAITGTAKATAAGFGATASAQGIDPSHFYSGDTNYGSEDTVALASPNIIPNAVAGTGSIGAITGTAYASANGMTNGASAHAYGIHGLYAYAGIPFSSGAKVGQGNIGAITGTAKAYAFGPGGGSYSAHAFGIFHATVNAGYGTGQTSASTLGQIEGYATSSNLAAGMTPTGTSNFSRGVDIVTGLSGGSISGITGKAMQGSASGGAFYYGIDTTHLKAGTSIGIIKATNTGTGESAGGIEYSTFKAGTSIAGIYAKVAGIASDAIWASGFSAAIAPGATAGIGYIKAYVPASQQKIAGIANSAFTTSGNIGNITVTGSVFKNGNPAGSPRDSSRAICSPPATSSVASR